ncbi:hypothetical protein YPPY13_1781, partial [Yersinia pestis PY-13]
MLCSSVNVTIQSVVAG